MQKGHVISTAKTKLLKTPFDVAHDIFHHYKVWENVLLITIREGLTIDLDRVEIASWWHDYERGSSEHLALTNVMEEAGYLKEYIDSIKDLINSHSFSDERSDIEEEKVLFDADKLEYVNSGRLVWIGEGISQGLLEPQIGKKYGVALQERIFKVVQTLYYPSTKLMMIQNLTNFMTMLPRCKNRYQGFLADVREDELVKALDYLKFHTS